MRLFSLFLLAWIGCSNPVDESACRAGASIDCFSGGDARCGVCCDFGQFPNVGVACRYVGVACRYVGVTCMYEASEYTCTDEKKLACTGGRNCPHGDM